MEGLFEYMLNDLSCRVDLTILLNKCESLEGRYRDAISVFKIKYSNAYQLIKNYLDYYGRFYLISPASSLSFEGKWNTLSLKDKESLVFLDPFCLTLGLDHYLAIWAQEYYEHGSAIESNDCQVKSRPWTDIRFWFRSRTEQLA